MRPRRWSVWLAAVLLALTPVAVLAQRGGRGGAVAAAAAAAACDGRGGPALWRRVPPDGRCVAAVGPQPAAGRRHGAARPGRPPAAVDAQPPLGRGPARAAVRPGGLPAA